MRLRYTFFYLLVVMLLFPLTLDAQEPVVEVKIVTPSGIVACDEYSRSPEINFTIPSVYANTQVLRCREEVSKFVYKGEEIVHAGNTSYSFDVSVKGGDVSSTGGNYQISQNIDLRLASGERHNIYYIKIIPQYNDAQQGTPIKFVGDSLRIDVYATPSPEILNDNTLCGYLQEFKANTKWSDISTYKWEIEEMSLLDRLHLKDFSNADSSQSHVTVDSKVNLTMKLTEITGNTCISSVSKEFTVLGKPAASIWRNDSIGICPQIQERRENVEAYLVGWDTYGGVGNYKVTLSNGKVIEDLTPAKILELPFSNFSREEIEREKWHDRLIFDGSIFNIKYITNIIEISTNIDKPNDVYIQQVEDENGCVANYASGDPNDHLYGQIEVYDRTPHPSFDADTMYYQIDKKREVKIPVNVRDRGDLGSGNYISWKLGEGSEDFDVDFPEVVREDNDVNGLYTGRFLTNMNGFIHLQVTETNRDDFYGRPRNWGEDGCATSANVTVYIEMPFRYPNAISPNGDGVNDCLRIEGLPDENDVFVCDMHGKKVFEKHNYRNDWQAEDLDDGYYVYVFKGKGTKTVKETLIVKRNNK